MMGYPISQCLISPSTPVGGGVLLPLLPLPRLPNPQNAGRHVFAEKILVLLWKYPGSVLAFHVHRHRGQVIRALTSYPLDQMITKSPFSSSK